MLGGRRPGRPPPLPRPPPDRWHGSYSAAPVYGGYYNSGYSSNYAPAYGGVYSYPGTAYSYPVLPAVTLSYYYAPSYAPTIYPVGGYYYGPGFGGYHCGGSHGSGYGGYYGGGHYLPHHHH